jgi:hypothetical protein
LGVRMRNRKLRNIHPSGAFSPEVPIVFLARDYASRYQIYHFIYLTLRLFSTPTVRTRTNSIFSISFHHSTCLSSIFFHIISLFNFSSIISISFHYSTYFSSVFSISFHYSTYFSSIIATSTSHLIILPLYMYIHCFSKLRRIILE